MDKRVSDEVLHFWMGSSSPEVRNIVSELLAARRQDPVAVVNYHGEDDWKTFPSEMSPDTALYAAPPVLEGWVMVPKEPTMGQWDDFCAVLPVPFNKFIEAYKAIVVPHGGEHG